MIYKINIIKEILSSIEHDYDALNTYIAFVRTSLAGNTNSQYTEKHHICPKAQDLFPEFRNFKEFPWNCLLVTVEEHIKAHELLTEVYPYSIGAKNGLAMILRCNNYNSSGILKNTIVVKDTNNNYFRVDKNDPRYIEGLLVPCSKGLVTVKDKNHNTRSVTRTDFLQNSLVGICKGKTTVINAEGKTYQTDVDDPDIKNKTVNGVTYGKTVVRDSKGNTLQVNKKDPRIAVGDLISINKNKVAVRDNQGNTFQVSINDPRYISGELQFVLKGKKAYNRKLTEDQVCLIRKTIQDQDLKVSDAFLKSITSTTSHSYIDKGIYDNLKTKNHRLLTYKLLVTLYFSKLYNMQPSKIKDIIEYKSYK